MTEQPTELSQLSQLSQLTGGCFCGEVRYRITTAAELQLMCYCNDCLSTTGTAGYGGYMVKNEGFQLLSGTPTQHSKPAKSGRSVVRHFCPTCGSNLWGQTELGMVSVAAGTLDDPNAFHPTKKVFVQDAPQWACISDALEEM